MVVLICLQIKTMISVYVTMLLYVRRSEMADWGRGQGGKRARE